MSAESYATQNDLIGIITKELLVDPVRIRNEPTLYEREPLRRWLQTITEPVQAPEPSNTGMLEPAYDIKEKTIRFVKIS